MKNLLVTTHRPGIYGAYFLVLPDHAAGKRPRYTLYQLPTRPSGRMRILGRELTLSHCKKLAEAHQKKVVTRAKKKLRDAIYHHRAWLLDQRAQNKNDSSRA